MFALIAHAQQTTELAATGYIAYGAGDFDGQSSGHDYMGVSSRARFRRSSAKRCPVGGMKCEIGGQCTMPGQEACPASIGGKAAAEMCCWAGAWWISAGVLAQFSHCAFLIAETQFPVLFSAIVMSSVAWASGLYASADARQQLPTLLWVVRGYVCERT
jgi:hypothetical protein